MTSLYYIIAIVLYALIGLASFEWAWAKTKALREAKEEIASQYLPYRRNDATHWRKWWFYPGALVMLPLRYFALIIEFLLFYLLLRLVTIGHDFSKDEPV